jgi:exopolysaccharide production protein ExoY
MAMQESIVSLRQHSAGPLEDNLRLLPLGGSWKRAFDVTVTCVALVALMPLIILTAILVRLLTKEPTFLSERLIGRGGKIFVGYRFRTPVANADSINRWEEHVAQALSGSSLDKLPQFFNVIRGDMSLIGPRPRAAFEFRDYFAQAPECLRARPGLISISQSCHSIFNDQGTEIARDRCYVSNWSLGLDFALLKMSAISGHRDGKLPELQW